MIARLITLTTVVLMMQLGNLYAVDLNPVMGKAGDFVLREADMDRLISYQSPETQKIIRDSAEQRTSFIRQILLTKAIAAKARKEGFDKKPEIKEIISHLIDQSIANEYLNKIVLANITTNDDEIKKYYAEHEKDFLLPETVKVRHIFIASPKDSPAEIKEKAKIKAEDLLRRIKKGEEFGKIAVEYSEDSDSASKGGDIGFITAGKTNSLEFETAALGLKPTETSNLVETPFGFHIIRVDEKREQRTATLDEAKEYIQAQLKEKNKQKKGQEFLDNLVKESGLEVIAEHGDTPKEGK